ncbi:MAG TPA: DUF1993 domain-containing protein [Micropepsaceae bacterium]|jgi:hypothetical protein|nr:DUF1993 domain-containing protein [Micropepsaceae bacterium]
MAISMYRASAPIFLQMLPAMSACLDKAQAYAETKKVDPSVLLQSRLYPDMLPLARQVQIACDFAKNTMARLAGADPVKIEDTETTVEQLKARIARTIGLVNEFKPSQIDGSEDRDVTIPLGGQTRSFKGENYLTGFALPNFFFHVTTAYAILRHNGVELGKNDYIRAPG